MVAAEAARSRDGRQSGRTGAGGVAVGMQDATGRGGAVHAAIKGTEAEVSPRSREQEQGFA